MSDSLREDLDIQETEFGGRSRSTQRRVIHFSSGETLEEEEDSEEEDGDSSSREAFRDPTDKAKLSWKNVVFLVWRRSLRTCDFLGEKLAGLLGLNAAKYQYAIDQYHRDHKKITSCQGTEEGLCEEGAEQICLSPRLGREYGATSTLGCPADRQASNDKRCVDISKGSHNKCYQEDAEDHLK